MLTPVVPTLSFPPDHSILPPPGQLLLITDDLMSSADFLIHRTLAIHLKEITGGQVVLVSLTSEFAHWKAIAARSNVNLSQHLASRSLIFIDGMGFTAYDSSPLGSEHREYDTCPPLLNTANPTMRSMYDLIDKSLQETLHDTSHGGKRVVVIDDISTLEMVGLPVIAITRFVRALRALCISHSASLMIRAHTSETSVPFQSDLLRSLLDSCHAHIEVRPLTSGRSGAVSGEIAVYKSLSADDGLASTGRYAAMQYRLHDGGAVFFNKGMGAGVL